MQVGIMACLKCITWSPGSALPSYNVNFCAEKPAGVLIFVIASTKRVSGISSYRSLASFLAKSLRSDGCPCHDFGGGLASRPPSSKALDQWNKIPADLDSPSWTSHVLCHAFVRPCRLAQISSPPRCSFPQVTSMPCLTGQVLFRL
ncbi:hypothetical protein FNV43_RR04489 [Rhamnella rubrinervis]|uniref:Uncharacterized protein n=1 Tax=Rhamnella rubrinervis TaxID=2594499 RepID=A0A8K0MPU0_9ROSA|nr:hypothetical protein FNV43_RR04489 [Rhamnella rubrinervis]